MGTPHHSEVPAYGLPCQRHEPEPPHMNTTTPTAATVASEAVLTPAATRKKIAANPTALLLYLHETQHRLEWLSEDMLAIQQQVQTLQAIGNNTRTHRYVGQSIVSAISYSLDDLTVMRRIETVVNNLRNTIEGDLRQLNAGTGHGLPDATHETHLDSSALAQLIQERTGMSVREAAATLDPALPQVCFLRPRRQASAVRNARLIYRYGDASERGVGADGLPLNAHPGGYRGPQQGGNDGNAGAGCLPSAMAGIQGDPAGIASYQDAYYASWESQARLFAAGMAIDHDMNRRRFVFKDGSQVEIQSHVPLLKHSADSRLMGAVTMGCATLAGAIVGGPVGAIVAGTAALVAVELAYPYDAAWQGYTIQYFQSNSHTSPWATGYFYGWQRSQSIADKVKIPLLAESGRPANFADDPGRFSWWKWHSGNSAVSPSQAEDRRISLDGETQRLIQIMASSDVNTAALSLETSHMPAPTGFLLQGQTDIKDRRSGSSLETLSGVMA